MMNLALVLPAYKGGGAEKVSEILAKSLTETGNYKVILYVGDTEQRYVDNGLAAGLEIRRLPAGIKFYSRKMTRTIGEYLSQDHMDVAIFTIVMPEYPILLRTLAPHCRILFHLHGLPLYEYKAMLQDKNRNRSGLSKAFRILREQLFHLYRHHLESDYLRTYNDVDGYIVLCDSYRQQVEKIVGTRPEDSRVVTMYNPLPRVICQPDSGHGRTVLYVGRLSYADKRPDRLLRIWARVAPEYPDWRLKIVGDGPYRADMERMVQDLGIAGSVEFCGYCSDPTPYYAEASILCLTSEFEGWGMVLAEGQQAGVWPMAFDVCAGVRELVGTDGTRGTLVRPYSEKAYAGKLKRLMADPARLAALRPSMMTSTAKYAPDAVIAAWDRYLSSL